VKYQRKLSSRTSPVLSTGLMALVVAALAIVPVSAAQAATVTWSPAANLSTAGGQAPQVSVDSSGNAIAVWESFDGVGTVVQSRTSNDGGATWQSVVNLSGAGGGSPQVSFDAAGHAIAIWNLDTGSGNSQIQTRTSLDAGATWQPAVNLTASGDKSFAPQVSFDASGNAIAAWQRFDGSAPAPGNAIVQSRTSRDFGANWDPVVNVSASGGSAGDVQLVCDAAGNVMAIWARYDGGGYSGNAIVQTSTSHDSGANWDPAENLSANGNSTYGFDLSTDSSGNAMAIWSRFDGTDIIVQTRTSRDFGANWDPVVNVSAPGEDAYQPQVGFDAAGNAISIWSTDGVGNLQTRSSFDVGATWSPVTSLSAAGAQAPALAFDASGNTVAIWYIVAGSNYVIQSSASGDSGATWSAAADLATGSETMLFPGPQVAFVSSGQVIGVWSLRIGDDQFVQTGSGTVATLANTGTNSSLVGTSMAVSVGLLVAGALAIVLVRRRANESSSV
jgi:hypothetical protein